MLGDPADAPEVEIDPATDLAVLPYSSGTTGLSKGVMLTHHNLVANIIQTASQVAVTDDDVFIGALPFFHIYGMTVIMNLGLRAGVTIVTMPRFDLEQFLDLVEGTAGDARLHRASDRAWRSPSTRPWRAATSPRFARSSPARPRWAPS